MRLFVLTAMAVSIVGASTANAATKAERLRGTIDYYIDQTWSMQTRMGVTHTRTNGSYRRETSVPYILWALHYWKRTHWDTLQQYRSPPHLNAFLCIHRFEGSWTDSGGPYYGGLQMDLGFQRSYAPDLLKGKGTADHWTYLEQIWTAERAAKTRGFYPWPNTARYCGLL